MPRVPPSEQLLGETPRIGSLEQIRALERFAAVSEESVHACVVALRGASVQLLGGDGRAITRLQAKIQDRLMPGAGMLQESSAAARAALAEYAKSIERIHLDADRLVSQVEEERTDLDAAHTTIASLALDLDIPFIWRWDEPPPLAMPSSRSMPSSISMPPGEREALLLQRERDARAHDWAFAALCWHTALHAIDQARARWQVLLDDRAAAEAHLVRALRGSGVGQLLALVDPDRESTTSVVARAVTGELRGVATVSGLSGTGRALLTSLLGRAPDGGVWHDPPAPDRVASRWAELNPAQRSQLIREAPSVIGNLPGLPFSVRDEANRRSLRSAIVRAQELSPASRRGLTQIMAVLDAEAGSVPVSLIALDLGGPVPLAALGYGDIDGAEHVTWQIPGMRNDVDEGLSGWDRASRNLHAEQSRVLRSLGRESERTAVVAYLAYDTPGVVGVLTPDAAREAAPRLAAELDGSVIARGGGALAAPSVVAHSYGTPVAANALLGTDHPVTSFTMIASAGLDGGGLQSLDELRVQRDASGQPRIFTTMAESDALAPLGSHLSGRWQPNPQSAWRPASAIGGALAFGSDGDGSLHGSAGHAILRDDGRGYLDRGTQSLRAVALLALGIPELVPGGLTPTDAGRATAPTLDARATRMNGAEE